VSTPKPNFPSADFPRPLVTVDVVMFTVLDDALQVLLVRRPPTPPSPFRASGRCRVAS
jgi:8-oxo-dGTP diphosphatase